MKSIRWLQLILMLVLLTACSTKSNGESGWPPFGKPTPTLPSPIPTIIHAPDAEAAMRNFLEALKNNDYASMYTMLSKVSQDAITQDDFSKKYNDALNKMGAAKIDYDVLSQLLSPNVAQVGFRIIYHTALVGDVQRDMVARFNLEGGEWRLQWDDGLILPELTGGNHLEMDYQIPARGNIYDRNGQSVAAQADVSAFGIIPGQITPKSEGTLVTELSRLCGINPDDIRDRYVSAGADWYI